MMARIAFGQGTSKTEKSVESIISRMDFGPSTKISYERVPAGITNLNWLVFVADRKYFLKLYGANTDSFIDRVTATAASRQAGELGIGPTLLAQFSEPGAEVYEFLEGFRNATVEDMRDHETRKNLVAAYRSMHGSNLLPQTRTAFDQLAQRVKLARKNDVELPDDLEYLLAQCARVESAIAAAGMTLKACHNDSYAANFMVDDAKAVRILDWEYASNNDPMWDLGMLAASSFMNNSEEIWTEAYLGKPCRHTAARLRLYSAVVGVSWGIWATSQVKMSTIEFDYRAHSAFLFDFSRRKVTEPSWVEALCQL